MIKLCRTSLNPLKIGLDFKNEWLSFWGIIIALSIIGIWIVSLVLLCCINISKLNILWIISAIIWQTFLYTGLFITAHDAMHGVVFPKNPKVNNFIGAVALFCYAMFPYQDLLRKHWLHHHHPASELDPDFHDNQHKNFFAWYFHFMKGYFGWRQIIGFALLYNLSKYGLNVPNINLYIFWVIPTILSSLQLFYFGTFLTHQEPEEGYTNPHRARTNPLPIFWSLIACYHFSYHEEHHEYPHVPWWKLPEIYRKSRQQSTILPGIKVKVHDASLS